MEDLSRYNNTTVRIRRTDGEDLTGPCVWNSAEFGMAELGREEESLQIGEDLIYADEIQNIELIRPEVCIPVRDWPEAKDEIAEWFHSRWGVPLEAYRESIRDCLAERGPVPQWYVVVRGEKIIAGCGVIENDFHERKDLTPNVCAVYVDEEFRNQGIAGFMLQFVCEDMAKLGIKTLYLLTDHIGFYERYGWEFYDMVKGCDEELSRMYIYRPYCFRLISNQVRFGCGYRTVDGKRQYFAWHGYPNRNDDFITNSEISREEFEAIKREYPHEIVADRETAEVFRKRYVDGHPVLLEGWNRLL